MLKFVFLLLSLFLISFNLFGAGDPVAGREKSQTCAACHGVNGHSTNPVWPKLAGQHPSYIVKQLEDFKAGRRENAQMSPMATNLSKQDMEDLAAYYAIQKIRYGMTDPVLLDLGEKIYRAGNIEHNVPACMACHGPTGLGNPAASYPALSGQHAAYIELQLNNFREDIRANDINQVMRKVADRMSDDEIKAVSSYVRGLRSTWE
ncbi:MAG: cytochrome c4 [Gammaproteobacteria bacterium]|nr:c-type cytochrome [Gammaproteobacteria bacterium]NIN62717.1 c-type cytochrome [Gammaproteobacteria bacterium]NIO63698.1 c-type cytochrome [Gammaproteobacteria bacterium]NIP50076.1 cytochrome c4 [Gammaproteobacteria bacterium]NIQ12294.1 cytochrome c4 [Gammaproteobacteria bacterium]